METEKKYTMNDILEMLGGTDYFSDETIQFVFHSLNGNNEKALYYKEMCMQNVLELQEKAKEFKTEEEYKALNTDVESKEEI